MIIKWFNIMSVNLMQETINTALWEVLLRGNPTETGSRYITLKKSTVDDMYTNAFTFVYAN